MRIDAVGKRPRSAVAREPSRLALQDSRGDRSVLSLVSAHRANHFNLICNNQAATVSKSNEQSTKHAGTLPTATADWTEFRRRTHETVTTWALHLAVRFPNV